VTYVVLLFLTTTLQCPIIDHNITPIKRDDWNASRVCL